MDLIVGATGFVGTRIAFRLREAGRKVRAVVRGGAQRTQGREFLDAGIDIVDAELTLPQTLEAACEEIDTVVTTVTSMPYARDDGLRRVDHEGTLALIEAAERAGVQKFVYTSYSGNIRIDSPLETAKRACEDRLLKGGMAAVILRPSYFTEVWLNPILGFDPANGKVRIYGPGTGKVSYIAAFDVAEFAVAAVTKIAEGKTILEMGGPEALSQLDVVKLFEQRHRKKIAIEYVPIRVLEQQHGSKEPLQKTFAALQLVYAKGDVIADSRATAERFGIRLRSVQEYVENFSMTPTPQETY